MRHEWSIARRLFIANTLVIVALTVIFAVASLVDARDRVGAEAEGRMLTLATAIADSPMMVDAATAPDPTALLQDYTARVLADADVDFITIMDTDRTRWTHPTESEIGKPYIGTIAPALEGHAFTEVSVGTLGPSVRAVVPVIDDSGTVVALVAAGVRTSDLTIALNARIPTLLGLAFALLVAGSLSSWMLGRYLARVTLGQGPEQLARLFVYYDSVLHSLREGLVLVSLKGDLVLYNDQAAELLGIPARAQPSSDAPALADLDLPPSLHELLSSGREARDEIHLTGDRVLVVSQHPATAPTGRRRQATPKGTVVTIRDHTDLQSLDSELQSMRTLAAALRAQTHEHSNRLHTIVSLIELGRADDAVEFATNDLQLSQRLTDDMVTSLDEPVVTALLMGKSAQAHERGIELRMTSFGSLPDSGLAMTDLVTVLGNLIDNALDAAALDEAPRWVELSIGSVDDILIIEVSDSGPGIDADDRSEVLRQGYSTKEHGPFGRGLGLALVRQAVARLGGTLSIGERDGAVFTVAIPVGRNIPVDHGNGVPGTLDDANQKAGHA